MDKIKSIKQNDEPMPQFNQKYRTYIERLERKAVNNMTSHTQMDLYMSTINPHIAKALRTNIHYGFRYTATSVGDAMKKAEECYLKDLYTRVGLQKYREQGMADKEVTCAEISTRNRNQWQSGGDRQRTWSSQENQGTEIIWSIQECMTSKTEMITQIIEHTEILWEVTEMER